MVQNSLVSKSFEDDFSSEVANFKVRKISGPRLYAISDGVLDSTMLNDDGNRFARYYFDFEKGNFVSDYQALLVAGLPGFYYVLDTWDNYERLANRINERFKEWQINRDMVQ